ncbi:MAG: ATP-dependent RNA helicase HrpA [Planctomycetes bacterium]|nr:ATP-dependent RNA helicase HrpA [Planctomycetota bacterium]
MPPDGPDNPIRTNLNWRQPLPPVKLASNLPIAARAGEVINLLQSHRILILCGETGSGKTTQLPLICIQAGLGLSGQIGHTQPRRIAARAVAARIAEELGGQVGPSSLVGCKVRFGDESSDRNLIKVMTDGVLLAELQSDPNLNKYQVIIIDEAHERSLNIDLLLGCLKTLAPRRPDLKIIITSATIDTQRLSDHFGGPAIAPIIEVSGRMYPVQMRYRPATRRARYEDDLVDEAAVVAAVEELSDPSLPEGDTLIFLPGEREIRSLEARLRREVSQYDILPLYARLSAQEQSRIFAPHSSNSRPRLILATNVAETSLTIPGIRYVIDTGLARINRFDERAKVSRLPIEPVSQASAKQRAGRCGRLSDGICIRLYSQADHDARPAFTPPEIFRTNLAGAILHMKSMGIADIEAFPFVERPSTQLIANGFETLFELGAITRPNSAGALTSVGRTLSRLPVDVRIGRILIAAQEQNCLTEGTVLAAALSIADPRERPQDQRQRADDAHGHFKHETSDFLSLLNIFNAIEETIADQSGLSGFCRDHFLSFTRVREWLDTARQLRSLAHDLRWQMNATPAPDDAIHKALLTGLIANVACREDAKGFEYTAAGGATCAIFPGSALFKTAPRWIMAAELVETSRLFARTVAAIRPEWMLELAPHLLVRDHTDAHWHTETQQVTAFERVTLFGLTLTPRERVPIAASNPTLAREIFIREALADGVQIDSLAFTAHNAAMLAEAKRLEATLRQPGLIATLDTRAAWFEQRVPPSVVDAESLSLALTPELDVVLRWTLTDALTPAGQERTRSLPANAFPTTLAILTPSSDAAPLDYALAPGKEEDGITATINLTDLPDLSMDRCEWVVPGLLSQRIAILCKQLPKPVRTQIEQNPGGLTGFADEIASLVTFGEGTLADAICEAAEVARSITISPGHLSTKSLPDHLRLLVRVVDHRGNPIAQSRDLGDLIARLSSRAAKARAARIRLTFERGGLTTFDFELPESIETESGNIYIALIDDGDSARLTLVDQKDTAAALTQRGMRRLLALAVRDDLMHRLHSHADITDLHRQYGQLGSADDFDSGIIDLIVERTYLDKQSPIRDAATFDERLAAGWGKLGTITIETIAIASETLEARQRIASRFSGGTPRLWASSVADLREHAAYLMPPNFLKNVPLEHFKNYPRYVQSMKRRLEQLRENGVASETGPLTTLAPHWKRFTAHVAKAFAQTQADAKVEIEAASAAGIEHREAAASTTKKHALPPARRGAPVVPSDAGEWSLRTGSLTPAMLTYRWALEDFRLCLFTPDLASRQVTAAQLDTLWKAATS